MSYEFITVEQKDRVGVITLHRPKQMNALSRALMGELGKALAAFDADEGTLRAVFGGARRCAELLRAAGHPATELSMGMSGDYEIAVEEGATMVRLGTVLFGARSA